VARFFSLFLGDFFLGAFAINALPEKMERCHGFDGQF